MRIHITTTPSKEIVPFNYQPALTGALHKWIGKNKIHDSLSLYSFSWLKGGQAKKDGLLFESGASFFISMYDNILLKKVIEGIREKPDINYGLEVTDVLIQEDEEFGTRHTFYAASPILIKRRLNGKIKHYTWDDDKAGELLTETLQNKLDTAGIEGENVNVKFDSTYQYAKTKIIKYNGIGNKVNLCPVIIKGTPEQLTFAWNVGLGNSTGIGFGAIK